MKRSISRALFLCPILAWLVIGCGNNASAGDQTGHAANSDVSQGIIATATTDVGVVSPVFQDKLEVKAEGNWSEQDAQVFYNNCMKRGAKERINSQINIENYCSCLKGIMLENNYRPDQLSKAVKAERKEVIDCLTGSIIKDE